MNFQTIIEDEFDNAVRAKSDISEHLELLYDLACECDHVTEMGSRFGASTMSFLRAPVTLRAYDLEIHPPLKSLFDLALEEGKDVKYQRANVLKIMIEPTDMLFIDTWHSQEQLRNELKMHAGAARKYLAFHDTHTYGVRDEQVDWAANPDRKAMPGQGLLPAIIDFVITHPEWNFKIHRTNNNGLTVLEKRG